MRSAAQQTLKMPNQHRQKYNLSYLRIDYCKIDLSEVLTMKCPFYGETLIEGDLSCPNCRSLAIDFDYFENMDKMREKYSKTSLSDLSKEKLTFDELITIFTYIERVDHHGGDGEVSDGCRQDGTFSNLSKRLKEIKNE